jgi:hypothetical protein
MAKDVQSYEISANYRQIKPEKISNNALVDAGFICGRDLIGILARPILEC